MWLGSANRPRRAIGCSPSLPVPILAHVRSLLWLVAGSNCPTGFVLSIQLSQPFTGWVGKTSTSLALLTVDSHKEGTEREAGGQIAAGELFLTGCQEKHPPPPNKINRAGSTGVRWQRMQEEKRGLATTQKETWPTFLSSSSPSTTSSPLPSINAASPLQPQHHLPNPLRSPLVTSLLPSSPPQLYRHPLYHH